MSGLNLTLLVAGHNVPDLLVGPGAQDLYQHAFLRPRTLHRTGPASQCVYMEHTTAAKLHT